jgi:hypothetical protein
MDPLAPAHLPAVWTRALLLERRVHLPLHHDFLQRLEHRFARHKRAAERLRRQGLPFHTGAVLEGCLAIVRDGHHLYCDFHNPFSPYHVREGSCPLIASRSKCSGWKA